MPQHDVTRTELAVLEVLWDRGPSPVRDILSRLYPGGKPTAHATVQKLLERLEAKGFVERDRSGPVQVFAATVDRAELIDRRLRAVADLLCGGSLSSLASHLLGGRRASAADRRALRTYHEDLEADPDTGDGDAAKPTQ